MADIKISQLQAVTSVARPDILAISKDLGVGQWGSRSVTVGDVWDSFNSPRLLKVSKCGVRDADNIKDAVAIAAALIPTQINPVSIRVAPGYYLEDNPITIPEWVSIFSDGGYYSAEIVAKNDGNIFVSSGNSTVDGFTIVGNVAYSNVAYYYSNPLHIPSTIKNCIIMNCSTGVLSNNGSVNASYISGLSMHRVFEKFMSSINGGFIVASDCTLSGVITRPTYGYYSASSGSEIYMFSCNVGDCANGVYASDNGYMDILSCHFDDCDSTIHVGAIGTCKLKIMGTIIEDSIINDLFIESALAQVAYTGHLDSSKFSIVSGATVNIIANDDNISGGLITGKADLQGKVSIGSPGAISLGEDIQVNIGEGEAFVNDKQGNPIVEYWSYDASAPSGSRFTRFADNAGSQLTSGNDAIIIGCKYPFPAIRINVDVGLVTSNYISTEYWDGSSWKDLGITSGGGVAGYRRSDFMLRSNLILRDVETQFVEFNNQLFTNGDWSDANNVLNEIPLWDAGDSFYAIRFRNNGPLTSGMTFSDGMVKPHSFMVSTSGKKANFGLYRTDKSLYIDTKQLYLDPNYPPASTNLQMSTNITFSDIPVFSKANARSQITSAFLMPSDIDTSTPVTLYVDGAIQVTDPGTDMLTTVYISVIHPESPPTIGTIPETEVDQITTITTNANSFVTVSQEIDISEYGPNDLIFVAFARFATDPDDTFGGDYIVGDIVFSYKSKFV